MNRKELIKELHRVCEENMYHGSTGYTYYSSKKGWYDSWYIPKDNTVLPFDENYNIEMIYWHPDKCHGIQISMIHRNYHDMEPCPERIRDLFWDSVTNDDIARLIEVIGNCKK